MSITIPHSNFVLPTWVELPIKQKKTINPFSFVIMKKLHVKVLLLAGIVAFSANVFANNGLTQTEESNVELSNNGNSIANNETLKVPVTATISNNVLNVQFTGSVPMATVTVSNAMTGATISQQSLPAVNGTVTSVPVAGLTMGTVTVTNLLSGESVNGEFVVTDGQE